MRARTDGRGRAARRAGHQPVGHPGLARPGRVPGQPRGPPGRRARRGARRSAPGGRSTATTSTTRSTAWWSRSTTSPCSARSGPRRGPRAGPSPTSSRPRSARPRCSTSRSRSGGPGKATPFAVLEPVFVGGSTVGLATLHNEDQVRLKDVRPGRHRHRAQGRRRDPRGRRPAPGEGPPAQAGRGRSRRHAPCAPAPLVRLEGESDTFCTNLDCPGQRVQRIAHFASRSAMDIEGLGEQRVQLLVDHGLLVDVADLYSFTAGDLRRARGVRRAVDGQPAGRHRRVAGSGRSAGC